MEIKAPIFPESIADGSVAQWHHQPGDFVARDTLLVDIETDKVVIEVFAPEDGVLQSILKAEGETVLSEEPIAHFEPGAGAVDEIAWLNPPYGAIALKNLTRATNLEAVPPSQVFTIGSCLKEIGRFGQATLVAFGMPAKSTTGYTWLTLFEKHRELLEWIGDTFFLSPSSWTAFLCPLSFCCFFFRRFPAM